MAAAVAEVRELMDAFAARTGLSPVGEMPRRYLWTDAFAVCNFLELYRRTGEAEFRDLALGLVDQVHRVLGRHRPDDPRTGWLSGLGEEEGRRHPTAGGLRIGKELPERGPAEPWDERREWNRDGQYYHYLTKWMHALRRVARVTGVPTCDRWARELARAAGEGFTAGPRVGRGPRRMYWKMSIDLSRPLVPSMGHHDPLDGLVTCLELQAATGEAGEGEPELGAVAAELRALCRGRDWATTDPLGICGLLFDAGRLVQLAGAGAAVEAELLDAVLDAALRGLAAWTHADELGRPAGTRLAFRELGLAIGLEAAARLEGWMDGTPEHFGSRVAERAAAVRRFAPLGARIARFWLGHDREGDRLWAEHRDIDDVMLATSLAPGGFLGI